MNTIISNDGKWRVYGLYDGRNSEPFYVGLSLNVPARVTSHLSGSPCAPVLAAKISEMKAAGRPLRTEILGVFETKVQGLAHEWELIQKLPQALNVIGRRGKKKKASGSYQLLIRAVPRAMHSRLDRTRAKRGMRSVAETVLALLDEGAEK